MDLIHVYRRTLMAAALQETLAAACLHSSVEDFTKRIQLPSFWLQPMLGATASLGAMFARFTVKHAVVMPVLARLSPVGPPQLRTMSGSSGKSISAAALRGKSIMRNGSIPYDIVKLVDMNGKLLGTHARLFSGDTP